MLLTVQNVRKHAVLTTSDVTGDGPGSENPVDCREANKLVLLLTVTRNSATTAKVRIAIDWTSGKDNAYMDTSYTVASGVATTRRTEYEVDTVSTTFNGTPPVTVNMALPVDVEGRWARVRARTLTVDPSLGVLAMTGLA